MSQQEEKLSGGNVSQVYRVEDTVRREIKPESERIHKLLKHLEEKGFSNAPRFMGIDEKGRGAFLSEWGSRELSPQIVYVVG
ncbi:hypothetical protein BACI349Y_640038 [Bacillus sp. 349Y]|nr:hypothetical protein BACI349Y_640038 [Bacillus sp. 349Y]